MSDALPFLEEGGFPCLGSLGAAHGPCRQAGARRDRAGAARARSQERAQRAGDRVGCRAQSEGGSAATGPREGHMRWFWQLLIKG